MQSNAAIRNLENERVIVLDAAAFKTAGSDSRKTVLDDLFFKKPVRVHVRETAALFSAILLVIGAFSLYKGAPGSNWRLYTSLGAIFYLSGTYLPISFYPIWKLWMGFASVLERIMTGVIVSITWFGIFVPFSFVAKLFGAKSVDLRFAIAGSTYWETRSKESGDFKLLERQF